MSRKPFHFKQFHVYDDHSTMKVGTDAIILGIWTETNNAANILDIGTGCGVIALILAQKSSANITAIDIDKDSIQQANINFKNSPWHTRLEAKLISLQDFIQSSTQTYDLIVSNPPYFSQSLKPENKKRQVARHTVSLSFTDICQSTKNIMNTNGSLYVILPFQDRDKFLQIANINELHLSKEFIFIPKSGKKAKRVIMCLKHSQTADTIVKEIVIREKGESHTKEFMEFTNDYYI